MVQGELLLLHGDLLAQTGDFAGAFAKFRRRNARWNTVLAFVVTLGEAVLTLLGLRLLWRSMLRLAGWLGGLLRRRQPV